MVGVLELSQAPMRLLEEDVIFETHVGGGPGGQHKNKTESAVRAKHLPTGLVVSINGRDQHTNKRTALEILRKRVNDLYSKLNHKRTNEVKRSTMGDGSRGEKVRTYNFMDGYCKDHRTGIEVRNVKAIMKGRFDMFRK
jgi:peptide chain release factor 1